MTVARIRCWAVVGGQPTRCRHRHNIGIVATVNIRLIVNESTYDRVGSSYMVAVSL